MGKLEALIILVMTVAMAWLYHDDGLQRAAAARSASEAIAAAQSRDAAAATKAAADCLKANDAAVQAGEAIARLSAPRARPDPKVQPMIGAADIREAMQ